MGYVCKIYCAGLTLITSTKRKGDGVVPETHQLAHLVEQFLLVLSAVSLHNMSYRCWCNMIAILLHFNNII